VAFGANGIKRADPDYYAAYVMMHILGGGGSLTSRLGREIREKRGLAYSVATILDLMVHAATWQGRFSTRNEKAGEAVSVLQSVLKEFAEKGPTAQELEDAKKYLVGSFVLHLDSNTDLASFLLSMQLQHLPRDYLKKR